MIGLECLEDKLPRRPKVSSLGVLFLLGYFLQEVLVIWGRHQTGQFSLQIFWLDYRDPAISVRVRVDPFGCGRVGVVDLEYCALDWGVDVSDGLYRFDRPEALHMGYSSAYFWKVDVDDFVQRVLSIVRYSYSASVSFYAHPFMSFRIVHIFRNLVLAFHRSPSQRIYGTSRFSIKIPRRITPWLRVVFHPAGIDRTNLGISTCSQPFALYLVDQFWDLFPAFDSEHLT